MSHFYSRTQGARGPATRCGTKSSGVQVVAAGWQGAIKTYVYHKEGRDWYEVTLEPWAGSEGRTQLIATGLLDSSRRATR